MYLQTLGAGYEHMCTCSTLSMLIPLFMQEDEWPTEHQYQQKYANKFSRTKKPNTT